jgi:predicted GNAT superfamily acetyltransferase
VTDAGPITIRDLATLDEYLACVALQDETWGDSFSERVPPAILRVSQRIGGVCAGAFDATGNLIAFVFGMTGVRAGRLVHWSDMLAVREAFRGQHLGERLKQYQRHKVLALGVELMLWTYDPLVARNAHFNINRLGARPIEYIPDMYGSHTGSALHGSLPTDRFVVSWDLVRPPAPGRDSGRAPPGDAELAVANPLDGAGLPLPASLPERHTAIRVQVPRDLQEEQRAGGDRALRWRLSVRAALVPLHERGYRVTRFVRAADDALPYYVLTPLHHATA